MILCLDVGNSHIFGGVFIADNCVLKFRYATKSNVTSDELGVFLRGVLKENQLDPQKIQQIGVGSVVPSFDYSLRAACMKYFKIEPFMVTPGVKTGLNLRCKNPQEVGADRVITAVAASHAFPNKNLIIVDYGTATTFDAITDEGSYIGGAIVPGIRLGMQALQEHTAKLPSVEIIRTQGALGRSTVESIQIGLYLAALGSAKEIISGMRKEIFTDQEVVIVGTGGFSQLFTEDNLFDVTMPDLVLHGIRLILAMNQ